MRWKETTACDDTYESVSMSIETNMSTEQSQKRSKSSIWNHYEEVYVDVRRDISEDIKQDVLVQEHELSDGKASMSEYSYNVELSREYLLKMIILHDYPHFIVGRYGFQKYLEDLQPLFKVPSRATINSEITKICETQRGYALRCLEENESRIALTFDTWTTSNQKKGYMVITSHYIDGKWSLQNQILSFIHVLYPHTAEALSQAMMECLLGWNIDNKLSTLTLDNCSTSNTIVDKLLGTLSSSSLMLKGKIFHMRCFEHMINLVMQEGFSIIEGAIKNVRNSVAFWTSSRKRVQEFRLFARQLSVNCEKELVLDCKTRWNSTYMMLNVALEYKDVFSHLCKKEGTYVCLPSEDEWAMASIVREKLKLFYSVTKKFSGTLYPTSNIYFALICQIKVSLLSWKNSPHDVIRKMASSMLIIFNKYWSVMHEIMSVAVVLDPRYKLTLIKYFFLQIYDDEAKSEVTRIRNLCENLIEEYKKKYADNHEASRKGQTNTSAYSTSYKTSWEIEFEALMRAEYDDVLETCELDDYLAEKLFPDEDEFDILMWWKCHGSRFPMLQRIARDVLAIPISKVASESTFSMSRNQILKQCSRLNPETVGALMCSQSWLQKELQDKKD